jgi:hypothetical protein
LQSRRGAPAVARLLVRARRRVSALDRVRGSTSGSSRRASAEPQPLRTQLRSRHVGDGLLSLREIRLSGVAYLRIGTAGSGSRCRPERPLPARRASSKPHALLTNRAGSSALPQIQIFAPAPIDAGNDAGAAPPEMEAAGGLSQWRGVTTCFGDERAPTRTTTSAGKAHTMVLCKIASAINFVRHEWAIYLRAGSCLLARRPHF